MNDKENILAKLAIRGIIARLEEMIRTQEVTVQMSKINPTYMDDYYDKMILTREIADYLDKIKKMIDSEV